ncbi:MAG: hypothetical protein QG602_303 [Verrucomicrobiota bacterium]|nr:hypothetical protein [Verrucomicrobiota bacterium]
MIGLVDIIDALSRDMEREMHKRREARRPRIKRGATLRPSDDTPLWNAVISLVEPRLARRGSKALLARELGLHKARVGEFFKRRSAMPDAERTLRLLIWLSRQPTEKSDAAF